MTHSTCWSAPNHFDNSDEWEHMNPWWILQWSLSMDVMTAFSIFETFHMSESIQAQGHALTSGIKHAAICKHLPTCTQLIKQTHKLLFLVIFFFFFDIKALGCSSLYWIDSQTSPAALKSWFCPGSVACCISTLSGDHKLRLFTSSRHTEAIYEPLAAGWLEQCL